MKDEDGAGRGGVAGLIPSVYIALLLYGRREQRRFTLQWWRGSRR
jgi:hypothetical protein